MLAVFACVVLPLPPPWFCPTNCPLVATKKAQCAGARAPTSGSMILTSEWYDSQELDPSELVGYCPTHDHHCRRRRSPPPSQAATQPQRQNRGEQDQGRASSNQAFLQPRPPQK